MVSTNDQPVSSDELLRQYLNFLRNSQALAEATCVLRRLCVEPFLRFLNSGDTLPKLYELAPSTIHEYVIATSRPLTRASRKHLVSGLRSFLRFAHVKGWLQRNLVEAVPVILTRKLDRLPRTIAWEDVQKLLAAPDRTTLVGKRDYAILRLVASYGLRIGQAIHLRVGDIDFRQQLIHFPAEKGCKALPFPVLKEVAEALLDYLRERGDAPTDQVFLTVRGARRPLGINNHPGSALKSYFLRAGIRATRYGAHAIRHAFATRLMQQGTPLKEIADLLGHRSIETTFLYIKVDVDRLRRLAVEWPEVTR